MVSTLVESMSGNPFAGKDDGVHQMVDTLKCVFMPL